MNMPADPYEAFRLEIESLFEEAENYLDGAPIATQQQADDVSALVNRLRKASKDADQLRIAEKKPHDDAAAAVQAKWKPLLDRAKLAADTAKNALTSFLRKQEEAQRAAAEAAAQEARRKTEAAAQAAEQLAEDDLTAQANVRSLQDAAEQAQKHAARLDKAKVQAKGGERAVSLRTRYSMTVTDPKALLRHYAAARREDLLAWLMEQAERDGRAGNRNIPGVEFTEEKVAA